MSDLDGATRRKTPSDPPPTLFLQREPYRRRRLIDAARVLPVFGAFLLLVPSVLVARGTPGTTSAMMLFVFGAWIALIVGGGLIARYLHRTDPGFDKSAQSVEAPK